MDQIYNKQDFLIIESSFGQSPGAISKAYIKYKKPSGSMGQFLATVDEENNMFYYLLKRGEYLEAGTWTFWNYAVMSDNRVLPGTPWTYVITEEGKF